MSKLKKILFLSHWMTDITGSSVVILEAAKVFMKLGYEAHVGCLKLAAPMSELLAEAGVASFIIKYSIDPGDYEIIWCQHITFGIIDIERYSGSILPAKIVFSHLGPSVPLELPTYPLEKAIASAILSNSRETMEAVTRVQGNSGKEIVFHNAAPASFKEARRVRSELLRVQLISNHHVPELEQAAHYLREHYHLNVQHIGVNTGAYRLVSPFDLAWADVVVTIGKSAIYSLLGGLPVYVYGPHGGDGYLTNQNFERNRFHNFSGRPSCIRKSAKQIADEIVEEWYEGLEFTIKRQSQFDEEYCLDDMILSVLTFLKTGKPVLVDPEWIFAHRLYKNVVQSLSIT